MASPNFPSTGLVPNETKFTVGALTYLWDGEKWRTITAKLSADQITYDSSENAKEAIDSKLDAEYMALKIFQSPTDGGLTEIQTRTVDAGEVYEVRKTSDDSLATVYSDAAGTTEIVQNGTSNVSGSNGVIELYIGDGDYYMASVSNSTTFNVASNISQTYSFDSIEAMKESVITFAVGKKLSTGGTSWKVNSTTGLSIAGGLFAKPLNGLVFNDYSLAGGASNKLLFDEAMTYSKNFIISSGTTVELSNLDVNVDNVKIHNYGTITVDTAAASNRGITLSGKKTELCGGGEVVASDDNYMTYLVFLSGEGSGVDCQEIHYPSKPNYVGDGLNIPYNKGGVGIAEGVKYCKVTNCEIYHCEGASVYSLGSQASIKYGHHHDNVYGVCLAGLTSDLSNNSEITGVRIEDNNASTGHLSGADGILTFKITSGHSICNNKISGSSEHGTYIQSSKNVISGNHIWKNAGSGLKCGGAFNSIITSNVCWENCNGIAPGIDDADIYVQSPLGNSTISSNSSTDSASFGIRVVWLENKEEPTEELRVNVSNNIVTGSSLASMRISGRGRVTVKGNICDKQIEVGQSTVNHPNMTNCTIANNTCGALNITKLIKPKIENNDISSLILFGCSDVKVVSNTISNQTNPILLKDVDVFDDNEITYSNGVDPLFEQASNKTGNSNKKIRRNNFILSGSRVAFFSTESISGDNIQFEGNTLSGQGVQPFYAWGDNHSFCNNKTYSPSNTSLAFIRGTNCVITSNMGQISTENTETHQIANNLSPV